MSTRPQTPTLGATQLVARVKSKIRRMQGKSRLTPFVDGGELIPRLGDWLKRDQQKAGGVVPQRKKKLQEPPDTPPWERKK